MGIFIVAHFFIDIKCIVSFILNKNGMFSANSFL
jgi:hypothetical protein